MKKKKPPQEDCCALCGFTDDDPAILGEKVQVPELKRSVHYFCLLTSCGIYQKGQQNQGVFGFLLNDIKKEMRRSSRLRCSGCKHKGATVGCFVSRCRKKVHFPCARRLEFVSQFTCPFPSFCPDHSPSQSLSPGLDLSLPQSCSVCLDQIEPVLSFSVLKCPSCHSSWFHRDCVQRQAHSSGLFFFRCTLCNNKDQFQEEMLRLGIHIPERDASWELESGAFSELLEVYRSCDSVSCECPEGRGHSAKTGHFEMSLSSVRLQRTHRKCFRSEAGHERLGVSDCLQATDGKPALMASPHLPQRRSLSRLSTPPPVAHKRPRLSASEASPQQLLRALRPRLRLQHQVSFRLRPPSSRARPLTGRLRPLLEVGGDDALTAALELVRRKDFDPTKELSVRFRDDCTTFPRSPGGESALLHFLDLLLPQIQDCDVFEGPKDCKNLALNAQALKEDLYFDVGVLLALALVYGAPCLRFFSPIQSARSVSELQSVLSSCSDHLTLSGCNRPIRSLEERAGLVDDLIAFSMITRMQLPLQRFREGLQTLGVFEQVQLYPSVFFSLFTSGSEAHTSAAPDETVGRGYEDQREENQREENQEEENLSCEENLTEENHSEENQGYEEKQREENQSEENQRRENQGEENQSCEVNQREENQREENLSCEENLTEENHSEENQGYEEKQREENLSEVDQGEENQGLEENQGEENQREENQGLEENQGEENQREENQGEENRATRRSKEREQGLEENQGEENQRERTRRREPGYEEKQREENQSEKETRAKRTRAVREPERQEPELRGEPERENQSEENQGCEKNQGEENQSCEKNQGEENQSCEKNQGREPELEQGCEENQRREIQSEEVQGKENRRKENQVHGPRRPAPRLRLRSARQVPSTSHKLRQISL
ncbi:hypothetical protein WMY93_033559 [Mugilogobius chulae]|uniref:PHD-type domain-containing protein n=1 Tax=Mugilogobius chulae TaxID=88201 RepID=A0AAW0MMM2_9GOBI